MPCLLPEELPGQGARLSGKLQEVTGRRPFSSLVGCSLSLPRRRGRIGEANGGGDEGAEGGPSRRTVKGLPVRDQLPRGAAGGGATGGSVSV